MRGLLISRGLVAFAITMAPAMVHAQGTPEIPDGPPATETPQPPQNTSADDAAADAAADSAAAATADAAAASNDAPRSRARRAPSFTGETGLRHVASADVADPGTMRLSFGLDFFSSSSLYRDGDSASRVAGVLAISGAPIEHLELWLNTRAQSARSSLTRPELLQSLGDLALGAKGSYALDEDFTVGADVQLTLLTGVGSQSFELGASQLRLRALGTYDFARTSPDLPLRVHLDLGGVIDGSENLTDAPLSDPERFAQGSSAFHRLLGGIALELPLGPVTPYLEYSIEVPLGYLATPGIVVSSASPLRQAQSDPTASVARTIAQPPLQRVMPQRITPGLRMTAMRDLTIDLALDIGLTPDTGPGVLAVPPYEVALLFSYAFEPFAPAHSHEPTPAAPLIVSEPVPPEPPSQPSHVTGVVTSHADGSVLEGVVVMFDRSPPVATSDDGRFISHDLVPGPLKLKARKEGFEPATASVEIKYGESRDLKLALVPAVKDGVVRGKVVDVMNSPVANAAVEIEGPEKSRVTTNETGAFEVTLPEGSYTAVLAADGFYKSGKRIELARGTKLDLELVAKRRATPAPASLAGGQIKAAKRIAFHDDNTLAPEGADVLDAVADLLWANPKLRLRVESHTDNATAAPEAMRTTQKQAEAVVDYLVARGIAPDRLSAAGVGSAKPIAPNMTTRGRETNRRIELYVSEE